MANFRCDFLVLPDLVFPSDQKVVRLGLEGGPTFTYRNEPSGIDGHSHALIVSVVGQANSIETAERELRDMLIDHLNLLSFVLQSRFRIKHPIRLFDWEPHQIQRRMLAFHSSDPRMPPEPVLDVKFFATVGELQRATPNDAIRKAMKYFRYGMMNEVHEDQFFNFWLALEIIAEDIVPKVPVAVTCKACSGALICATCGHKAMRTPSARSAIEPLIRQFADPKYSEERVWQLADARNKLLHGASSLSIEAHCGRPLAALVNDLGVITWSAILSSLRFKPSGVDLEFAHFGGEFASVRHVARAHIVFAHDGPEEHPEEGKLPTVDVTMSTNFRGKGSESPKTE
jgi:hypothetical protein